MMGQGFGEAIARSIATALLALIVVAFLLGGAVMWGAPHLWAWLRPILAGWLA